MLRYVLRWNKCCVFSWKNNCRVVFPLVSMCNRVCVLFSCLVIYVLFSGEKWNKCVLLLRDVEGMLFLFMCGRRVIFCFVCSVFM